MQLLLVINLDVSPSILEILTFKGRKWLVFPTPPYLAPLFGGTR